MFQITANPTAKAAFDEAHAARGAALRHLVQRLFSRSETKTAGHMMHPAE